MEVEVMKEYIDIDDMTETILNIYKDARNDFKDGVVDHILDMEYNDDYLLELAEFKAMSLNEDMNTYLHMKNHHMNGNFCNLELDYPKHRTGEYGYNDEMFNDLVKRLDNECQDEQTCEDRKWLGDWIFEAFGTFGLKYNFQSEMSDKIYECQEEMAEA